MDTFLLGCFIFGALFTVVSFALGAAGEGFGHLNIVVNNAGIGIRKRPEEYSRDEFEQVVPRYSEVMRYPLNQIPETKLFGNATGVAIQ